MSPAVLNSGDTSWVLFCTAAVLFMTPGLALLRRHGEPPEYPRDAPAERHPARVITLTRVLVGYSLAFGNDAGNGIIADLKQSDSATSAQRATASTPRRESDVAIPTLAFVAYQMMFAVPSPPPSRPVRSPIASSHSVGRCSSRCGRSWCTCPIVHWLGRRRDG